VIKYNCVVKGSLIGEGGHGLFDSTIRGAVGVLCDFACHVVDGYREGLPLYISKVWTVEAFDEYQSQVRSQQAH
jgi:hypothetical protein